MRTKAICRPLSIVAGVSLTLLSPAIAAAHAGNSATNVIHACINDGSLLVRIVGVDGSCRPAETPVHWNKGPGEDPATFLKQLDTTQTFDLATGRGLQVGTVTGLISGTTSVEVAFFPAGPPVGDALPVTFQNKVIITDLDGDQIFFDNNGTGSFHVGIPGFPFRGAGGPLVGTYVVTGGTGKYASWTVGTTFSYRAAWTLPPNPPGALGTVYAEIR